MSFEDQQALIRSKVPSSHCKGYVKHISEDWLVKLYTELAIKHGILLQIPLISPY